MQIDYKEYVKRLIDYSVTDVQYLLAKFEEDISLHGEEQRRHAGPLLMVVMNGIDAFGGILYGFANASGQKNSKERSIKFMENQMKVPASLAEFLYISVRCGVTHHGLPKSRLGYEVWTDEEWDARYGGIDGFCKDKEMIYLNVIILAKRYLGALRTITPSEDEIPYLERELREAEDSFICAFNSIIEHAKDFKGMSSFPVPAPSGYLG